MWLGGGVLVLGAEELDTAWPTGGFPPGLSRRRSNRAGFDDSRSFRHCVGDSLLLAFPVPPDASLNDFSSTLILPAFSRHGFSGQTVTTERER
jgi:hypothetical protein